MLIVSSDVTEMLNNKGILRPGGGEILIMFFL